MSRKLKKNERFQRGSMINVIPKFIQCINIQQSSNQKKKPKDYNGEAFEKKPFNYGCTL